MDSRVLREIGIEGGIFKNKFSEIPYTIGLLENFKEHKLL